jgi:hypothetical protein
MGTIKIEHPLPLFHEINSLFHASPMSFESRLLDQWIRRCVRGIFLKVRISQLYRLQRGS